MENIQPETGTSTPQVADLVSSFVERHKKERVGRLARLVTNRKRIHKALQRAGATSVVVSYCGSGDSGQIDQVAIYQGETEIKPDKKISVLVASSRFDHEAKTWVENVKRERKNLSQAMEDLVYDWLGIEHPGWENNDGASGECTIDVAKDDFLLTHTSYYTESDTTEHSL